MTLSYTLECLRTSIRKKSLLILSNEGIKSFFNVLIVCDRYLVALFHILARLKYMWDTKLQFALIFHLIIDIVVCLTQSMRF